MIRVLVVDDSPLMRRIIATVLKKDPYIEVVGFASNGEEAFQKIEQIHPDVVTMDIEMPVMNGLEAIEKIMKRHPVPIVVISTLTRRGADITIKALSLGAVDFVLKPSAYSHEIQKVEDEIITKVKYAYQTKVGYSRVIESSHRNLLPKIDSRIPEAILIGVSTGGPKTLMDIIPFISKDIGVPIFIVQHMPPLFTKQLAETLQSKSEIVVKEAEDGELVRKNVVYIVPGGFQMEIKKESRGNIIKIVSGPEDLLYKPSVNYVGFSLAETYRDGLFAIMLTGMGNDGLEAFKYIKKIGGFIIAESEATAVVYGMPRAVVEAGIADIVAPSNAIAAILTNIIKREQKN